MPVCASANPAMSGVDLVEAALPVGVSADSGVACGVEVSVAGLFSILFAAEEDAGGVAGGLFVEEVIGRGQMLGAGIEIAA